MPLALRDPSVYNNREFGRIEFNARVLEQARRPETPPLGRDRSNDTCQRWLLRADGQSRRHATEEAGERSPAQKFLMVQAGG